MNCEAGNLSRRAFVGTMVVGATGLSFQSARAQTARPSGSISVSLVGEPTTMDAHRTADVTTHAVNRNLYEGLLRWEWTRGEDPRSKPNYRIWNVSKRLVPNLAESYQALNERTWQFKLRKGIKFHNGEDFNAESVKFSIERILEPATGAVARAAASPIERVQVIDEDTVQIVTKKPFPVLPVRLAYSASGSILMVPPRHYRQTSSEELALRAIGTGPFKFVDWKKGSHVKLEANAGWWRGSPAIQEVVLRPIPEPGTRVSALLSGSIDIATNLPPSQVDRIERSGVARVSESLHGLMMPVFQMDTLTAGPMTNRLVRQAINYAVDMDAIVKHVLQGHATALPASLSPSDFGFHPTLKPYSYDPAKAKELLTQAGYPNGFELMFFTSEGRYMNDKAVSEAVAGYLNKVGIRTTVRVKEAGAYLGDAKAKKPGPLFIWAWASIGDGELLVDQFHPKALYSTYGNGEFEDVLDRARSEMNPDTRRKLLQKAQEILHEDAAYLKGYEQTSIYGISNRVEWEPALGDWPFLHEARRKA